MERLNYHQLLYFWTVAHEGTVVAACRELHLAQPTLSAQIRVLEESIGHKLLIRSGRRLALTDVGKVVYRYAGDIFSLGHELMDVLADRPTGRSLRLAVGIDDTLPKLIAHRILEPAFSLPQPVQLLCHEGNTERLLADLSTYELDLVLTDAPIGSALRVRGFNHLLGESGVSCFAAESLAVVRAASFPHALHGAPFLMPASNTMLRRSLDQWFHAQDIQPRVVGEFADSALMKVFGQSGRGVFAAPSVIEEEIQAQYGVSVLGRMESISTSFHAISVERKLTHPGVMAIVEAARDGLFHGDGAAARH